MLEIGSLEICHNGMKKTVGSGRSFLYPLTDAGVKRDIKEYVERLMNEKGRFRNVSDHIEYLVKTAAEWGMSEGFRKGWKVYEVTEGGKR